MTNIHLYDFPKWLARKNTNFTNLRNEVITVLFDLDYIHKKVLMSGNEASYLIKQINTKMGIEPARKDVFDSLQDFTYHYDNYCIRLYMLRERTLLFINEALFVGFPKEMQKIQFLMHAQNVKDAGLINLLNTFGGQTSVGKLVSRRSKLTHEAFYQTKDRYFRPDENNNLNNSTEFALWVREWSNNVTKISREVDSAQRQVVKIHHTLATSVLDYREKFRKRRRA